MRILLADDDQEVAEYIRKELEDEGHSVLVCHDGASALRAAELHAFDIGILDVMMPCMDGLEVTRRLRRESIRTPILLLTARDAPEEVVRGLDSGADDYLTKPFSFDVLLARLRARTRSAPRDGQRLRFADLVLNQDTREVSRGKRQIALTRTEFALLECLMRAAGRIVSREALIEQVWGDREVTANNLEVFVRFLREKIDCDEESRLIHTDRGVGYSLRSAEW
ncbi:MAG TPA: response regulator transcription factor [Vicinamibacterales bacterium]|jgi:two-component system response regulator MprA|nr:response regulator transcription factor [Vicinamibacterales bacterium]